MTRRAIRDRGRPRTGIAGALPVLVAAGFSLAAPLSARPQPFGETGEIDASIPTPASILRYPLGERFTPHHQVVEYLEALAQASERVEISTYGTTYEDRPLVLLTISDPENLERQEDIRRSYARLSDPRSLSESEARDLIENLPIAVWLSFNIHGDEASGSEAAMALAYRLASRRDESTRSLLRETVVLVDPCLNPDGRSRYLAWLTGVMGREPDVRPSSREHHQPWPGGRYNHYLFDLNRDWAWLSQRESRARVRAYLPWRPQVHVDFHEMWADQTYFFFPPVAPVHPLYPESVERWGGVFGRANAAAFDERGWRYYTEESFDLFYPGYGDTWPTFQGATGMTYEQAGHGRAGLAIRRADGDTLTLAERSEHHYVAALTTVEVAAANRRERLLDFYRFFVSPSQSGPRAFLFPPGSDPPRTAELVNLLMDHGAEVYRTTDRTNAKAVRSYDGSTGNRELPAGTFVVPLDQPLHLYLRAILEPEVSVPDTFFYDVSAWSLPLAFGIEAHWTESPVPAAMSRVEEPISGSGTVLNPDATYAYLISWERNGAARAASWLMARDVRVHFAARGFTTEGRKFPPGTLVVFRSPNPEHLPVLMQEVAEVSGAEVRGTDSGMTTEGPDLGSSSIRKMHRSTVAVLADRPTSPTSVGACWFLFDQLYDIPYSLITLDQLVETGLEPYSVLVLPDDERGGAGYAAHIDSTRIEVLRDWIERGGVLVGLGGGAFFASAGGSGLSSVRQARGPDDLLELSEEEQEERHKADRLQTQSEREREQRLEKVPGTIFKIKIDPLHPLGFGYSQEARVLKISNRALELGPPGSNVAWFTSFPKVSGYASPENVEHLVDRPFLVDEKVGRGHVVLYVEDPNFRLFWYGLTRLFLNSIYFLPGQDG